MSFFVLSGFVIAEAIATYYQGRPWPFLFNRMLRIFPPFAVALAFSLGIHWFLAQTWHLQFFDPVLDSQRAAMLSAPNVLANALCLIVIYGLSHLGLPLDYLFVRFVWAVAVELHFYYVAAGLMVFTQLTWLRRSAANRDAISAGIAILLAALFVLAMTHPHKLLFYAVWIPYFSLGVGIFHLVAGASGQDPSSTPGRLGRHGWALVVVLSVLGVNWHAYQYMVKNPANWALLGIAILDFLIAALYLLGRMSSTGHWKKLDQRLGDVTYPLYLNHYAVSIATLSLVPADYRGPLVFIGNLLLCVGVSLVLARISEPLTESVRNRIRGAAV